MSMAEGYSSIGISKPDYSVGTGGDEAYADSGAVASGTT